MPALPAHRAPPAKSHRLSLSGATVYLRWRVALRASPDGFHETEVIRELGAPSARATWKSTREINAGLHSIGDKRSVGRVPILACGCLETIRCKRGGRRVPQNASLVNALPWHGDAAGGEKGRARALREVIALSPVVPKRQRNERWLMGACLRCESLARLLAAAPLAAPMRALRCHKRKVV